MRIERFAPRLNRFALFPATCTATERETGVANLDGDAFPFRQVKRNQRFDDDSFAKIVFQRRQVELRRKGGRKGARIIQALLQRASKQGPGEQQPGRTAEEGNLLDREEIPARLRQGIDVENIECMAWTIVDTPLDWHGKRIRRDAGMRIGAAEDLSVDKEAAKSGKPPLQQVVDKVHRPAVPFQQVLPAMERFAGRQHGATPRHADVQVVTQEGGIHAMHFLLHGKKGVRGNGAAHALHPYRIGMVPDGRVRSEL